MDSLIQSIVERELHCRVASVFRVSLDRWNLVCDLAGKPNVVRVDLHSSILSIYILA